MKCKYCGNDMSIVNNKITSEVDTTDVYSQLTFACTNSKCENFAGNKFENISKLVKGEKHKL